MPDLATSLVNNLIRLGNFVTQMRKRDLLLIGFVILFIMLMGVITGQIPSPFLVAMAQHAELLQNDKVRKETEEKILSIMQLQLYLQRETCMHGAKTESEKGRCDRQTIRDAILGDILPTAALPHEL